MKYSTIIVDDESAQQKILLDMLKDFNQYDVVDVCSSVDEAVSKVRILKPSLVFLDVVMPPKTGFDFLSEVYMIDFEIIFTTSFEKYAVNAFKVSAVDYLLKPFSVSDLRVALDKFEAKSASNNSFGHLRNLLENINSNTLNKTKIALATLTGFVFVEVGNIVRCEADNQYTTYIFSDKSKLVVAKNIKDCEDLLAGYGFFRIHNSHLINLDYVKEYIKGIGGQVRMTDGIIIDVSRRKKDEFISLLNRF